MSDPSTDESLPILTAFLQTDPYIRHYEGELRRRYKRFAERLAQLEEAEGAFDYFTLSYRSFGIQRRSDNGLVLREWAPGAEAVFLTGDFSKRHHAKTSVCYIQAQTLPNGQIYGAKYKQFIVSKETGFNFSLLMLEMLFAFAGRGICGVCIE